MVLKDRIALHESKPVYLLILQREKNQLTFIRALLACIFYGYCIPYCTDPSAQEGLRCPLRALALGDTGSGHLPGS